MPPVSFRPSFAWPQPGTTKERQKAFIGLTRRVSESARVTAAVSWAARLGPTPVTRARASARRASSAARRRITSERVPDDRETGETRWRERVGIEPTGAAGGVSIAVLKTG